MSTKWAVTDVVRDHYETFVDASTGRVKVADYLGMIAVPVGAGALVVALNKHVASVGELLAGSGVFTAGLFAMLLQVFPLAQRLTDDPRLAGQQRIGTLVDELEANSSYAVLVGLAVTGLLMLIAAIYEPGEIVSTWWSAVVIALLGHLLLTTLMCLKRIRAVYARMR